MLDRTTVEALIAAGGVTASEAEIALVTRALTRIEAAAAQLLDGQSFDLTGESFFRLLEAEGGR
jgi:hypothetical protein